MSASVLVAFATRSGSTQEVAEAIATSLRERGLQVDILPTRDVVTLDQYEAVVLGAPLYIFHWHKDALHFLSQHKEALMERPTAIFALGPLRAEEEEFQEARRQLDKELAKFPWLKAKDIAIFGGRFDPQKLSFP
jgi:menaquinone-dependent protoporphyrinogen oxidase